MTIVKNIRSTLVGYAMAVPPTVLFLDSQENIGIVVMLWLLMGIVFTGFVTFVNRGPRGKRLAGMIYARRTFVITLAVLSLYTIVRIIPAMGSAGGISSDSIIYFIFFVLTFAIFLSLPLFLIGYFRGAKEEKE